ENKIQQEVDAPLKETTGDVGDKKQTPPGKPSEQDNSDNNSEKDFFEESFQDQDFLSHVESIESQNSVDFVDSVSEERSKCESVLSKLVEKDQLILSPKSRFHEKKVFGCENRGNIQNVDSDSIGKTRSTVQKSVCDRNSNVQVSVCNKNTDKEVKDIELKTTDQLKNDMELKTTDQLKSEVLSSVSSVGSLRDRLKKKLLQNVGTKSPVSPAQTVEQGRQSRLKEVEREAAIIQGEGSADDIGPFYGLPSKVQQLLQKQRGITSLYEWQDECLRLPTLQKGGNLVYSLPTSGGKTLVAEVLILKELLCKKKDAMMILPFVSIVQEKVKGMAQLAVELDFLVEEYAGSKGRFPPIKHRKRSLYIATIEKAHSLVNSLIEQGRLDSLGLVVVDELHMIGEGRSRGSRLEATLLKIIYAKASTQIIGMSATLNNITDLLTFLKADVFSSDFRPVKLTEHVKLEDNIFEVQKGQTLQESLSHQRTVAFQYSPEMNKLDPDHLLGLVTEVVPGHSCLIFCSTKKNCENVALMLSKLMAKYKRELSQVKRQERKDLLKELYKDGEQRMCPVLQHTIHFGIAYHHSGLTTDERHLLEEAYSDGVLCLLACTSTLAAGVNLPAKRVILRNPYIGTQFLNRSQYKQMIGRAGRAGKDTTGESILIVSSKDRCKVWEIISGPLENCYSSLNYEDGKGIRSLILSTIGLQVTKTTEEVFEMMTHTLLSIQASQLSCDVVAMTKDALQQLIDMGLVRQKRRLSQEKENSPVSHTLEVTPLGRATFKGSVDLDFSAQLYKDLKKAEESLVLASYLHLLFLVTPYDLVKEVHPPWMTYFKQVNEEETCT
ncbi:helicase POLQ-like, partial [Saccostrea cucullata]|uniref:helicase POLQ-like n=1 Tax=Saccostrea cuccullata TaxID=36930 RepID=UPI002ED26FDE